MGVRFPSVQSNVLVNANVAINAETLVVTTPPFNLPLDNAVVLLVWYMAHTIGTTATITQYSLRRGAALASALIFGATNATVVAGNSVMHSGFFFDNPGAAAGLQYSLTCSDVASTGVGAIAAATLLAFTL